MCVTCVATATTAASAACGACGARAWLATRDWRWLTAARMRLASVALVAGAVLAAGVAG